MNVPVNVPRALKNALTKAAAECNSQLPQLEYLEALATAHPAIGEAVNELRIKHEHLSRLCRVGLSQEAGTQSGSPEGK